MRSGSRHRGEAGGGGYGFPPLLATDGRFYKGDCDMRTGAIFARGSCRALKWMALFGVVFALGVGSAAAQVTVTVADKVDEGATVTLTVGGTVSIADGTGETDLTVTFTAAAGDATPTVSAAEEADWNPGGTGIGTATISIPANSDGDGNANTHTVSGTFNWVIGTDIDAEDEAVVLTFTTTPESGVTATAPTATKAVTIDDSHTQMFEWGPVPTLQEGGTAMITLTANPTPVQLTHDAALSVSLPGYTVTPNSFAFDAAEGTPGEDGPMVTLTITAPADDENEVEDTIVLRALRAGTVMDLADPLSIKVADKTPKPEENYVEPKSTTEIDAAVATARGRVDDSNGKWMVGDDDIMIDLDDLFDLPADATMFTITAEATQEDADVVMATASASSNSVTVMAVGSGMTMVTVTVSANMNPSSATTTSQNGRNSASVMFDVTVDAPAPREPRALTTDAAIKGISISDVEKRRIGGEERLHLDEGDTVEVTMTVEWSVGQLRDLYDDSTGTPDPVVIEFIADPESDPADWLSPLDLSGASQDFRSNEGEITIKIPKMPAATKRDHERVEAKGSDRLNILEDDDAEDEAFTIDVLNSSMGVSLDRSNSQLMTDTVVIDDDETQGIEVKRTTKGVIYESGADQEFEVSAKPALVDLSLEIDFDLDTTDGSDLPRAYGVSPSSETIAAGEKAMVSVDIDENDGNRVDDELELHAQIDSRNRSMDIEDASVTFEVVDVHKLPMVMVSPKMDSVNEGEEIELTLTIDRNPPDTIRLDPETREHTHEAIDVMLTMGAGTTAGMGDYTLPSKVTFPEHNKKAPWTQEMKVKVMATEDNDLDDGEMLVLDAMVAGTVAANGEEKMSQAAVSTLTIGEGTGKLVWVKTEEVEAVVMAAKKAGMGDDMMFTAGEMIELEGNDVFGSAEGVSVGYTAMVEGDAVSASVSAGVVTVTAESMGMADVTITARASRPSGALTINDQTDPREASITIALEVGLVALSIKLEGPDDMNLVEGGMGGMVTATANRKVTENTMVMLMRDRAMSSADDMDFEAEPITIMAGQESGSTMVMAVEDDMMENMDNMPEELVLYGMAEDMAGEVTGEVKFYLWDAAVPALPVIAQLLLAAFLAIGGYRRYRRR